MSILIEASDILRKFNLHIYNCHSSSSFIKYNKTTINTVINGIKFSYKEGNSAIVADNNREIIYVVMSRKKQLKYLDPISSKKIQFDLFYEISKILVLRTKNSLFEDKNVLDRYLKALVMCCIAGEFKEEKEELLSLLKPYIEYYSNTKLYTKLYRYIEELSKEEYKQFEEFAIQECLLCKIKGISLRNLRVI